MRANALLFAKQNIYLATFSSVMIEETGNVKSRVESWATILLPLSANPATS